MINQLVLAIIILYIVLFLYPGIVFVIWTITNRDDVDDWSNGCPPIHTIGDLIDAMVWRKRNTAIGDALCTPLVNLLAAILITIIYIVIGVAFFIKWILECFYLTDHVKKVGKFFNKLWNKFKSITIFK
jgi:hypothetical protein